MTTATATEQPTSKSAPNSDGVLLLLNALQCSTGKSDAWRRTLKCIGEHFDSPFAAIEIESSHVTLADQMSASAESTKSWKRHCDGLMLSVRQSGTARARLFQAATEQTFAILAVPVPDHGNGMIGSIAVVSPCDTTQLAEARMSELSALIRAAAVFGGGKTFGSGITSGSSSAAVTHQKVATPSGENSSSGSGSAAAFSRLGKHESLHEFAYSIANDLKGRIQADQVSFSIVRNSSPELLCISGFDNTHRRSPGSRMIEQAMAECLDAGAIVCYQHEGQWAKSRTSTGHHLHRAWHEACGNVPVASIPLLSGEACVAVLSIRRPVNKPFDAAQLQKIQSAVSTYAPAIRLLDHAERSVLRHAFDSIRSAAAAALWPNPVRRALVVCAALTLCAWCIFRQTDHIITVPCKVAASRELHMAAPFEGVIAETPVRAGDFVVSGQLLARMNTEQLEAELQAERTQLQIARTQLAQHSMAGKLSEMSLADSRAQISLSSIATIEHHLKHAELRAPCDGFILEGNLNHRVGEVVPQGEPLLTFASSDSWSVELHVPEHSASWLKEEMAGEFAVNARPEETREFRIDQMEITADVVDGQNTFLARGHIDGTPAPWMRSGMQGSARINAGRQAAWWVWLHRVIDRIQMQVWKW
ncbi:MAG: efflux RND transporter periplasmic adaptor subunit [Planctomyces sp.]